MTKTQRVMAQTMSKTTLSNDKDTENDGTYNVEDNVGKLTVESDRSIKVGTWVKIRRCFYYFHSN